MLSTALLLAASMVVGQAEGEKAFKSYVDFAVGGVWTCTIDGEELKHSYHMMDGGQFLQLQGKGGLVPYVAIIGVDPKSKQCTWWNFMEDGGVGQNKMTLESDGVWLLQGRGDGPKGQVRYKGRLTRVGKDEVREKIIVFRIGDDDQGTPTNVWRRK